MIEVSIFGAAIRTNIWLELYENFRKAGVSFEMIFAGPNIPSYTLPDNFKHIHTSVKPAQAIEITRRACTGRFIMNTADDMCYPDDMLARFVDAWEKAPNKKTMFSGRYASADLISIESIQHYNMNVMTSPLVPLNGFLSRETSDEIGGLDTNFIGLYWDLDRALRLYELGGLVQILWDIAAYETQPHQLLNNYGAADRMYLNFLYGEYGKQKRKKPVDHYKDNDLLTISQGQKGSWT
jgi:hypothetical protein